MEPWCPHGSAEDLLQVVVFKAKDVTGDNVVGDIRYSLCRWDVSLGHADDMEPEFREDVLVGYVGVESDDVYGDKPHPVPERSVVLVNIHIYIHKYVAWFVTPARFFTRYVYIKMSEVFDF